MLQLLGKLYGAIADVRNRFYDRGVFRSHSLGARTISIGNITTGGTGKTPLVAYVAEALSDAGEKVCILTRGYGRSDERKRVVVCDGESILADARDGGDEPLELSVKLLRTNSRVVVIADADRIAAAAWAKERFGITAFVLDDGFQHRKAKRDLDIVCIDSTRPFGGGSVVPAGRLREPLANIDRADVLLITRSDLVESTDDIVDEMRRYNSHAPIFASRTLISSVSGLDEFHGTAFAGPRAIDWDVVGARADIGSQKEIRLLGFCGLGNPDAFPAQLQAGFDELSTDEIALTDVRKFPDHHRYSQADIDELERSAAGIHALVTTAKDAVKLKGLRFTIPCFVAEIDVVIDDQAGFRDLLLSSAP